MDIDDYFDCKYRGKGIRVCVYIGYYSEDIIYHIDSGGIIAKLYKHSGKIEIMSEYINYKDAKRLFLQLDINRREEKLKQLL